MDNLGQHIRGVERSLNFLHWKIDTLLMWSIKMSAVMDTLTAAVKRNSDVEDSAVLLIQGIAKQLADLIAAGADPAALTALSDELTAKTDALAAAVAANTPAAP
jgi:uncharacterized membrane protein affecting hemolysin expression